MNGCWRTEKEIKNNTCDCAEYDWAGSTCKSDSDTVSKHDGQPMCPRNPDSILRSNWNNRDQETSVKSNSPAPKPYVVDIPAPKEDEDYMTDEEILANYFDGFTA